MPPIVKQHAWKDQELEIQIDDGGGGARSRRTVTVPGKVLDLVGVHRDLDDGKEFRVTHLPTSLAVAWTATEADAVRIAEVLWERARKALSQPTKESCVSMLPTWVRSWCLECRRQMKFLDPKPYIEKARLG